MIWMIWLSSAVAALGLLVPMSEVPQSATPPGQDPAPAPPKEQDSPKSPETKQDPLDAVAWLDSVWLAFGPPEALEALGVVEMRGQASSLTSDFAGPFVELYHPDGRALQRIEFEGSDPVFFGVDRRYSWEAWSIEGVAKFDWHAAADWRRFFFHRHCASPGRLAPGATSPWRALYRSVAVGGRAELNGRPCVRLVLTPRAAREHGLAEVARRRQPEPDILWVDEATRLPIRLEMEMLRPAVGETRLKETFADWQAIDGILFPMRRTMEIDGEGLTFTIESIDLHANVESEEFDAPESLSSTVDVGYPSARRLPPIGWQVSERPARRAVVLRASCPLAEEDVRIGVEKARLLAFLAESGTTLAGQVELSSLTRGETATFSIVAPVTSAPTIPAERAAELAVTDLPAGLYIEGTHDGPRGRLDESLFRMDFFARSNGLLSAGPISEALLVPAEGLTADDPWHTILSQHVTRR